MLTKLCKSCKCDVDIAKFSQHKTTKDRISVICKPCAIEYAAQYRKDNPWREAWHAMKNRCKPSNRHTAANYALRGIVICERWLSFANYKADMELLGPRPSPDHSIDRIDNDKGYHPGNVRWADLATQAMNKRIRRDNVSGHKNITPEKKTGLWVVVVKRGGPQQYLGRYPTIEEAVVVRDAFLNDGLIPARKKTGPKPRLATTPAAQ